MNLRTLRYFVAIADAGSVTAAAEAVAIAQPALSRQMRELEAEMGVPLLIRSARGVRLTPAGLTLYESAQRMLAESVRVRRQLAVRPHPSHVQVTLGVSPTLAGLILPGLVEQCLASLPDLQFKAREAFTPELLSWVARGVVDMAVVTNPDPSRELTLYPLLGEPFALFSHAQLNIEPVVALAQLARVPLLMTSLHRGLVERQLLPLGGHLNIKAELDSVEAIRTMVQTGPWATIMPISAFKGHLLPVHVRISEISGIQLSRLLVLCKRADNNQQPILDVMHDMVQAAFARLTRNGAFAFGPVQ